MYVDYSSQEAIQHRLLWLPRGLELSKTQFFLFHVALKEITKKSVFSSPEVLSSLWNTCLENILLYSNILANKAIAHHFNFWIHNNFLSQLQRQNMFITEYSKNEERLQENKITYNPIEYGEREWSSEWNIFKYAKY